MVPKLKRGRISIENHSSSSDSEPLTDARLPQDLITEIFLSLPLKSLGKFKCVCKPWRSLISSPQFIKSHFSTSVKDVQRFNHQFLFTGRTSNYGMKHCSLFAALHNPSTHVSDIEAPCRIPNSPPRILGVFNGLVCLSVCEKDLYIWNPLLKQSKLLPASGSTLSDYIFVSHGFGYDESNDDYKVVQVLDVDPERISLYQSKVKVYSLRRDSWRVLEGFMDGLPFIDGTYVNGKIFWTIDRNGMWKIVSLDMASDKIKEVQGPSCEIVANQCVIGSFGGSLSMLFCEIIKGKVDLWVMDKNGIEESWSKVLFLPCYPDVHPAAGFLHKVVCIIGDSEIVMEDRPGLTVYCTRKKEFRKIQLDGGGIYRNFFVYVESLVPV